MPWFCEAPWTPGAQGPGQPMRLWARLPTPGPGPWSLILRGIQVGARLITHSLCQRSSREARHCARVPAGRHRAGASQVWFSALLQLTADDEEPKHRKQKL